MNEESVSVKIYRITNKNCLRFTVALFQGQRSMKMFADL